MEGSTFLTRVVLKNYRSIEACDVRLGPLTFLVGPNGAGKSNFVDALRFVTDALHTSLEHAIRDRGGINEVRRRSRGARGRPTHFGMRLEFVLPPGGVRHSPAPFTLSDEPERFLGPEPAIGHWAFQIGARPNGGYEVQDEQCVLYEADGRRRKAYYHARIRKMVVSDLGPIVPPVLPDRLSLVTMSGSTTFRSVYDALSRMGFYNLNPDRMRELQAPDPGTLLRRDGANIAAVLSRLANDRPQVKSRIEEYLAQVVPGIRGVDTRVLGPKETLEFRQEVGEQGHLWRFPAASMSDGTLRALGTLVALFQGVGDIPSGAPLVGIEEPEVALHPAAAGVLRDSLRDASMHTQVIVTSHSPDLLDDPDIPAESILGVIAEGGTTRIGQLDAADRSVLRDRLYTAGELLRLGQLVPARDDSDGTARSAPLFDPVPL